MAKLFALLVCLSTALYAVPTRASPAAPADGRALLERMHERYAGDWYDTVKFTQKSTTYNADGSTREEWWFEQALLPGRLRIDFGEAGSGNALLMTDGKAYRYANGKLLSVQERTNLLLVLGFDVYRQNPDATLAQLRAAGIDLREIHERSWHGQRVYVVGAHHGDLHAPQFWIDKRSLLFVRLLAPDAQEPATHSDIRFTDYRRLTRGFIAARVEVYHDRRLVFTEDYSDIETDIALDPSRFEPEVERTPDAGA